MGYNLNKHRLMLREERRIFFKRQTIIRFTRPLAVMFSIFFMLSIMAPAFASSQLPSVKPCATHLPSFTHFSANAAQKGTSHRLNDQRIADQKNMLVQLSFLLGARHALTPHMVPNKNGGNLHDVQPTGHKQISGVSHALAIAAYRACQKDAALKQQRTARRLDN